MAGPMVGPLLAARLDLIEAYFTPDGNFPDHEPNPMLPENREFIMGEVVKRGADLGIAWDGDADRCFFIDETGRFVDGDFLTALMSESMIDKNPGATVLYDVRASRAVADTAARVGGKALMNRVGHAFFKTRMRAEGAVFGGEVSGHYYFRDFYCADSGTLPALLILELLSARSTTMSSCWSPTARSTSSRARSTPRSPTSRPSSTRSSSATRTAAAPISTGSRSTTTTGTSTSARPTPSRCCASAWSRCARPSTWPRNATRCSG